MTVGFYPKLAWNGISKNRKLYLPYLLTCVGTVAVLYILAFLSQSAPIAALRGGEVVQMILSFGVWVLVLFSLIFLFYTNSFLIRRRKKEFGLYNILGMGKTNLAVVLLWETAILFVLSLFFGLFSGILFSKWAELCLINIQGGEIAFSFSVDLRVILFCIQIFAVIFALIFLNALRQIRLSKPVELIKSETVGEKPPKANWVVALLGVVILAAAYTIAVRVENPIDALAWFFVAVLMVIVATYMLFVAGSVALCKLLQKKKSYYYKTNRFISVSSMLYRMKRNGAGLASICILSTMVLVMISSTVCLYFGSESSLKGFYPRDMIFQCYETEKGVPEKMKERVSEILSEYGAAPENIMAYRYLGVGGYLEEDVIRFDRENLSVISEANVRQIYLFTLDDYNVLMGDNETLKENEILLYTTDVPYEGETLTVKGGPEMTVKRRLPDFIRNGEATRLIYPSLFIVVKDSGVQDAINVLQREAYGKNASLLTDYYAFDLPLDKDEQIEISRTFEEKILNAELDGEKTARNYITLESLAVERSGYYALTGGFFFLGVLLTLIFIAASVLILYYKQISEGFEDQSRFQIMRKVGLTKREIKKSINSQVLTVFFLPLFAAGVHTAFAFPMIARLLTFFSIENLPLLIGVTVGVYLVFGLFYTVVYRLIARVYYGIVSV